MKAKLASYKVAFVVGKHKKPRSECEHYIEFARATDPDSQVFKQMVCSRTYITRRFVEIHEFLKELKGDVSCSILELYVRQIDRQSCSTGSNFLRLFCAHSKGTVLLPLFGY